MAIAAIPNRAGDAGIWARKALAGVLADWASLSAASLSAGEIVNVVDIPEVPANGLLLKGTLNVTSREIPLLDTRVRLGVPTGSAHPASVLIVRRQGWEVGLILNRRGEA